MAGADMAGDMGNCAPLALRTGQGGAARMLRIMKPRTGKQAPVRRILKQETSATMRAASLLGSDKRKKPHNTQAISKRIVGLLIHCRASI